LKLGVVGLGYAGLCTAACFGKECDVVGRESRGTALTKRLFIKGARVRVTFHNPRDCVNGSDSAVVVTPWEEFKSLEPVDFVKPMRAPLFFDARRIYDPKKYRGGALKFIAIGLGGSSAW